jgi:Tfp pilus assembly protein PilV
MSLQSRAGTALRLRQRGFTLFETILVIGILTLVSLGLIAMQPQIFKAQTSSRDQFVGLELMQACAERLLAVRRKAGYTSVTNTLCDGMGNLGGFAANPTVALVDAANATVTVCGSATCTATILIAKSTAPAASLSAITLQLSAY